jgi:hypothetical protein
MHIKNLVHSSLNSFAEFVLIQVMRGILKEGIGRLHRNFEVPEIHGVLGHAREGNSGVILPMSREMSLLEYNHKLIQSHVLKVFVVKFKLVDKADILKTVKCTFDNFVGGDVFVIGVTFTSTLPVDARLRARITHVHIWRFRVRLLINSSESSRLKLGEYGRHLLKMCMRWGI